MFVMVQVNLFCWRHLGSPNSSSGLLHCMYPWTLFIIFCLFPVRAVQKKDFLPIINSSTDGRQACFLYWNLTYFLVFYCHTFCTHTLICICWTNSGHHSRMIMHFFSTLIDIINIQEKRWGNQEFTIKNSMQSKPQNHKTQNEDIKNKSNTFYKRQNACLYLNYSLYRNTC